MVADTRVREIMQQAGMEHSLNLYKALKSMENEATQETVKFLEAETKLLQEKLAQFQELTNIIGQGMKHSQVSYSRDVQTLGHHVLVVFKVHDVTTHRGELESCAVVRAINSLTLLAKEPVQAVRKPYTSQEADNLLNKDLQSIARPPNP